METFNLKGRNSILDDPQLTLRNHEIFEEQAQVPISPKINDMTNITNLFSQES
jgi:hypothetical protein